MQKLKVVLLLLNYLEGSESLWHNQRMFRDDQWFDSPSRPGARHHE